MVGQKLDEEVSMFTEVIFKLNEEDVERMERLAKFFAMPECKIPRVAMACLEKSIKDAGYELDDRMGYKKLETFQEES